MRPNGPKRKRSASLVTATSSAMNQRAMPPRITEATSNPPTAATRPVLDLAERCLRAVAGLGGGTPAAWWLSILILAPLLGSFITEPAAMTIGALLDLGNLKGFSQRLVLRKPTVWTTEALRSEEWDANRLAVDALLKIRIEGKDYAGRAVYVLNRASGKLLLSEVPIFDVKVTGSAQ